MIPVTLEQIADIVGGELVDPAGADRRVDSVTIDSRTVEAGALFVPLRGEHTDGHEFVDDAARRGAGGYLWEARRPSPPGAGAVVVDDPADALLGLGRWVRETVDPLVVAVTGSSGKTTTKDLVAAAVGAGRQVVANTGSYNNELGVPLTCCRLGLDSEVLVAEVGARGVGHISRLAALLAPDVAVVTIVGSAHLEMLGGLDGVARAKSELVEALGPDGVAVLNADDERVAAMAALAPGCVVTYGRAPHADWRAVDVEMDTLARPRFVLAGADGRPATAVRLPVPGLHNVPNAVAALAVADLAGVDIEAAAQALASAPVSRWRMEVLQGPGGITVINDAYNANPDSMAAALRTLAQVDTAGRRWAVLGLMGELGPGSQDAHVEVGRLCGELGLDGLVVVGEAGRAIADGARGGGGTGEIAHVEDADAALRLLRSRLGAGDVVLVKASRSVGLEQVAERLGREDER